MSLFQRIKTPFNERADDFSAALDSHTRSAGALLRERREDLGYDLDAIGQALRIKPFYLAALEENRAQDLPGPAYAVGFVRAYAELLGLDGDEILDCYKAESAGVSARPDLSFPVPLDARSLPGVPILLVGVILALCGYGTWYYLSTADRARPERVAAVPAELQQAARGDAISPPAVLPPNPVAAASPASAAPVPRLASGLAAPAALPALTVPEPEPPSQTQTAAAVPPAVASPAPAGSDAARGTSAPAAAATNEAAKVAGSIDIRATFDCWIQVRSSDDQIVFSRVLKAGETYHVPRAGLLLRTGNAGALAVVVDGKPAPALGGVGTLRRTVALDPGELLAGTAVKG